MNNYANILESYLIAEEGLMNKIKDKWAKMNDEGLKNMQQKHPKEYANYIAKHPDKALPPIKESNKNINKQKDDPYYKLCNSIDTSIKNINYEPMYPKNFKIESIDDVTKFCKLTIDKWNKSPQIKSVLLNCMNQINHYYEYDVEEKYRERNYMKGDIESIKNGEFFCARNVGNEYIEIIDGTQGARILFSEFLYVLDKKIKSISDFKASFGDGDEGCLYYD